MTRCWPFIRLILRRAQVHALPRNTMLRRARLEGWGGPMVRDAAHEGCGIWVGLRSRLLTHEAGRDRECIKLNGIRFSAAETLPAPATGEAQRHALLSLFFKRSRAAMR